MKTRILGMGNTILTDDGVGIYVVREVAAKLAEMGRTDIDVAEAEMAGFALLELLSGWDRVIIVDAVQFSELQPGEIVSIETADLHTSLRLRSIHEMDLPTPCLGKLRFLAFRPKTCIPWVSD
jgi:hydrogenase maturation protease